MAHAETEMPWRALVPAGAGGRGRDGFAAPVTLPAAPAVPLAPQLLPYPDERWDVARLVAVQPYRPPEPKDEPAPPGGDVSRIVVGYLRTAAVEDADADAELVASISQYARERGLTLLRVHRDDVTDDDARRPGFSACLRHLYLREASAIVIPSWEHLAPNDVLRRALCLNATSAGGAIQVVRS